MVRHKSVRKKERKKESHIHWYSYSHTHTNSHSIDYDNFNLLSIIASESYVYDVTLALATTVTPIVPLSHLMLLFLLLFTINYPMVALFFRPLPFSFSFFPLFSLVAHICRVLYFFSNAHAIFLSSFTRNRYNKGSTVDYSSDKWNVLQRHTHTGREKESMRWWWERRTRQISVSERRRRRKKIHMNSVRCVECG